MEVQQEGEALGLDALAQAHHVVQVLAHLGVRVSVRVLAGGIHEQAHPQGVPAYVFAFHVFQHVGDFSAVRVIIGDILVVITLQNRNVSAHIENGLLGLRLRVRPGFRLRLGGLSAGGRQGRERRQEYPSEFMSHEAKINNFRL